MISVWKRATKKTPIPELYVLWDKGQASAVPPGLMYQKIHPLTSARPINVRSPGNGWSPRLATGSYDRSLRPQKSIHPAAVCRNPTTCGSLKDIESKLLLFLIGLCCVIVSIIVRRQGFCQGFFSCIKTAPRQAPMPRTHPPASPSAGHPFSPLPLPQFWCMI